jgi:Flp pilus assembly CpaE family ATPase
MAMKIAFFGKSEGLMDAFKQIKQISSVTPIERLDVLMDKHDYNGLVIEHTPEHLSSELIQIRNGNPMLKILLLHQQSDDILERICAARDIAVLKDNPTSEMVKSFIEKEWLKVGQAGSNHVVSISGTHSQVGTTQTAFSLAKTLANLNYKVKVLGLNVANPGELEKYPSENSFDTIYPYLEHRTINADSLEAYMVNVENFKYLVGNRDMTRWFDYQVEPVNHLIDLASETSDVVILDLGSFYNTALCVSGLLKSNMHILVTTQQEASFKQFIRWKKQILSQMENMNANGFFLLINKFDSELSLTPKHLTEAFGIHLLETIPYVPQAEDYLIEDALLYNAFHRGYLKAFDAVGKAVLSYVNEGTSPERKGSLLSRILR